MAVEVERCAVAGDKAQLQEVCVDLVIEIDWMFLIDLSLLHGF